VAALIGKVGAFMRANRRSARSTSIRSWSIPAGEGAVALDALMLTDAQ
jgi:hypothetical protein